MKFKERVVHSIANFLTGHPWWSLGIALVIGALLIPTVSTLQSNFSFRIWYQENDPNIQFFDQFQNEFGNDDNIIVLVHSPSGVFDKETIQLLQSLTGELSLQDQILRVDSLVNFQWVRNEEGDIHVDPLIPYPEDNIPITQDLLNQRREVALNHRVIPQYLLSGDGQTTALYSRLQPSFKKKVDYKGIVQGVRDLLQKYEGRGDHKLYITGSGALPAAFEEITFADLSLVIPLLFFIIVLLLSYIFRRPVGVVVPMIIILTTILSTLGLAGLFDFEFDAMTSVVPQALIAICIADCIHILNSYFLFLKEGLSPADALYKSVQKNLIPTFLTSASTGIGFFSLMSSDIAPIMNLGLLSGCGTFLAWLFSFLIIVPLLKLIPFKAARGQTYNINSKKRVAQYVHWIQNWKKIILSVYGVVAVGAIYLAAQNEINANVLDYFVDDVPIKIANRFMKENIGGDRGIEIVVDSGKVDGAKDPEFMLKVEALTEWISSLPRVTKVLSIVDILKDVSRALNENRDEYYKIDEQPGAIAQQLFLYTMSLPPGMDINYWTTMESDKVRINVLWTWEKSQDMVREINRIDGKIKNMGLQGGVTGKAELMTALNTYIVSTFLTSMGLAFFLVTSLMVIIFRSFKLGLLSMIPNVLPPIFGGALMTLLGKPMDTGTILVVSVCLGIAVDDTIHFLSDYHLKLKQGLSPTKAIEAVLSHTGLALTVTTLILVCGFMTFAFGQFVPTIYFGVMTALVLSLALLADLLILPAILIKNSSHQG